MDITVYLRTLLLSLICSSAWGITITNTTPTNYVWDNLNTGSTVFVDRAYTYTTIPSAYIGLAYLQTANNDKGSSGSGFITFNIDQDVTVYVGYDVRLSIPVWLQSWNAVGEVLDTSDTSFNLYSKNFTVGTVSLDGAQATGGSMYIVLISEPLPPSVCPWDSSILDNDPLCVECQWVPGIIASDPACIEPPPPPMRTLSWTNATENDCSSLPPGDPCPPLDDLAGVYVHDADSDLRIFTYITTTPGTNESVQFETDSTCFYLRHFDNANNESVNSETKCYVADENLSRPYIM